MTKPDRKRYEHEIIFAQTVRQYVRTYVRKTIQFTSQFTNQFTNQFSLQLTPIYESKYVRTGTYVWKTIQFLRINSLVNFIVE